MQSDREVLDMSSNLKTSCVPVQPMFSVTPRPATNATALVNPYLSPVSPGLVPTEILPSAPVLMTSTPNVPVPAAAAAAAQKLMRTDRLEVSTAYLNVKLRQDRKRARYVCQRVTHCFLVASLINTAFTSLMFNVQVFQSACATFLLFLLYFNISTYKLWSLSETKSVYMVFITLMFNCTVTSLN